VAFSPAAVKKALQIMGEDVGESRYAVAFNEQQLQQIRQIVTRTCVNRRLVSSIRIPGTAGAQDSLALKRGKDE
jgi:hypothetical protein